KPPSEPDFQQRASPTIGRRLPRTLGKIQVTREMQLLSILRGAFDESPWYGYVVAESSELLAIHTVSDRYDLDGYRVFRQGDITERKESFNRRELIETALRLKGLAPHAPSTFELFGMRELIESVQGTYGAVIINQEALRSHEVE